MEGATEQAAASLWRPAALYAAWLLLELVREPHAWMLSRWAPHAQTMLGAINTCLDSARVQQPGRGPLLQPSLQWHTMRIQHCLSRMHLT